ncbi:MAG TPA: polyprenyl synthetase family protein, partial [Alphaproteobacteria bacterium]|nr:polyprenyl synthetase family protein [Alphaproteobacteria bacterium]
IISLYSKEVMNVGIAEMDDIYFEHADAKISAEEILKMYEYKTAHYTFSLPLILGALISGKSEIIDSLYNIGESLGVIYQIRDDDLGIFGDDKLGKSLGIDIKSNKKTLHRQYLFDLAKDPQDKEFLENIFGNENLDSEDIADIQGLIKKYCVDKLILEKINFYEERANKMIEGLDCNEHYKGLLHEILMYVNSRTK